MTVQNYPVASVSMCPWARQPWRALRLAYTVIRLFTSYPYWIGKRLLHLDLFPRSWTLREYLGVQYLRHVQPALAACDFAPDVLDYRVLPTKRGKETRPVQVKAAGKDFIRGVLDSDVAGPPVDIVGYVWGNSKSDVDGAMKIGKGEGVLLSLHGGGFMFGNATEDDVTALNPRELLARTPSLQHAFTVDYRKVTQAPFPAAIIDSLSAYLYLIDSGASPSRIVVSGDSAGGSLALSLVRYIKDELKRPDLLPRAMVLFSPLTSLETDLGPKRELVPAPNLKRDLLDFTVLQPYMAKRLLMNNPISLIDSVWLSPASSVVPAEPSLFADWPPTFISAGGAEVLLPRILELNRRMTISNVDHEFHFEPDAPHDYQMFTWFDRNAGNALYAKVSAWLETKMVGGGNPATAE